MRATGPCLALLLVTACGDGRQACEVTDGGPIDASPGDDATTDEETALLEGAHLSVSCTGANAQASAELDLESARRVLLGTPDRPSTIQLEAVGSASTLSPGGASAVHGVEMPAGTRYSCFADFVEVAAGARFLALRCFTPLVHARAPSMRLTIDVVPQGDGLAITGTSIGAATCDVNDPGTTGSYDVTLSGTPPFFLFNETAEFP